MLSINSASLLKSQNLKFQNQLWTYVAKAFNKVDPDRLKLVGPDRLCAEWVLKNGGGVAFTLSPGKIFRDYNLLPPESLKFQIKVIDGTDSSIMRLGFEHLKGCNHIDKVILNRCKHLESDGLEELIHIKNTLKHLQVSSCYNIDDKGLLAVKNLTELKMLHVFDLPAVRNLEKVVNEIQTSIGCSVNMQKT